MKLKSKVRSSKKIPDKKDLLYKPEGDGAASHSQSHKPEGDGAASHSRSHKYRLLSDLMKYIPDVIYFKDTAGRLIMVNDAHAKGLRLKPDEVAGKTDFDFFSKERAQLMTKDDRYVMKTGKAIIDKIERSTRPDGIDNYVSTTKIPRYDEKGKIAGLIGITRDITRRMSLEHIQKEKEMIEKKLESAQELNRIKSEFVSVVSHELRTPLAIIKEAVLLLLDEIAGSVNAKQKDILLKAENNIKRLKGIIDDLLDISRIESGQLKLHYSLVNLNDLLKEGADFFKKSAAKRGINLQYIFPKEQVNMFLDSNRINQVLANLINNAIKFTEEDGSIKIELKAFDDQARIGIIDTGIGIAQGDLSRLFNKFTQVSKTPDAQRKGVGLGLSIAKELVGAHSGEIWVESKLGLGSRFYFSLPRLFSLNLLDKPIKDKINNLLSRGISLYFVNLLIINYRELKGRLKAAPGDLFDEIELIINKIFQENFREAREKPEIVLMDGLYGECGFILPSINEEKADKITKEIVNKLTDYFLKNKLKDVFINAGITVYPVRDKTPQASVGCLGQPISNGVYPDKESCPDYQQILANLKIKKILIGPQIRKFKRFKYEVEIQAVSPGNEKIPCSAVDISEGGICFYSPKALKTAAPVEVSLEFPKTKEILRRRGKVSWIKEIAGSDQKFKVGLEFTQPFLTPKNHPVAGKGRGKEKKAILRFLKSLQYAQEIVQPV